MFSPDPDRRPIIVLRVMKKSAKNGMQQERKATEDRKPDGTESRLWIKIKVMTVVKN